MFISVERYSWEWLWIFREGKFTPWVSIIFAMTLYGVLRPIIKGYMDRAKAGGDRKYGFGFQRENLNPDMYFSFGIVAMFAFTIYLSWDWEFGARLVPHVIAWAGILFTGALILSDLFVVPPAKSAAVEGGAVEGEGTGDSVEDARGATASDAFKAATEDVHFDIQADYGDLDVKTIFIRAARYFGWLIFFFAAAAVIGLLPAMFLFLVGYMRFEGKESWKLTLIIALPMFIFSYLLFHTLLLVQWPLTVFGDLFPVVREIEWLNLF